jgi:hypothetical protein
MKNLKVEKVVIKEDQGMKWAQFLIYCMTAILIYGCR